ncbi:hypothetical protein BJ170DRAFT_593411 [Xylariales sp. AK1849]|nr:hypothetical protein BJ170DRAFT_593411 [Xylariales sp. AK1849]
MYLSLLPLLIALAASASTGKTIASTSIQTSTITSVSSAPSSITPTAPRNYSTCSHPEFAMFGIDLISSQETRNTLNNWTAGCSDIQKTLSEVNDEDWPTSFQPSSFWPIAAQANCSLELRLEAPVALSSGHMRQIMSAALGLLDDDWGVYGLLECTEMDDTVSKVDVEWRLVPRLDVTS